MPVPKRNPLIFREGKFRADGKKETIVGIKPHSVSKTRHGTILARPPANPPPYKPLGEHAQSQKDTGANP